MSLNSNKDLYADKLFRTWSEKEGLMPIEAHLLNKYLTNTSGKVIEAGTGGGRIIFEIEKRGFKHLDAYDFVAQMIDCCNSKKKHLNSSVNFKIADATNLEAYDDYSFDYLIYLQQVLCFIDKKELNKALAEAYRIGKQDSTYLFSFLNWNSKFYNPPLSLIVNFLRLMRGEKTNRYKLPWLNINDTFNWHFLNKKQPQNLWFKEKHIIQILEENGFTVLESKTKLNGNTKSGHIHIAAKKTQ